MTKMSKPTWCCWNGISDSTTVSMVTICLIQGLLWSSFSVFLLAIQTCALQFESPDINIRNSSSNFTYVVNLIHAAYLSGSCTRDKVYAVNTDSTSDRTYNLLVIHGFLNAVWIPISVLLIVGTVSRLKGSWVVLVIYSPWLLVTFAIVALDLFSASLYVKDIPQARTLRTFLLYIRFKTSTDDIIPEAFQSDSYTLYAPVVLMLYFTRFVLLTIFNVVSLLHIVRVMCSLCRERKFAPASNLFPGGYDEIYSPIISREAENIPLQSKEAVGNYYTTDLEMRAVQVNPGLKHVYENRDYTVHDYLTLIQTPVYQHVYEDIWRDVKKEKLVYTSKTDRLSYNGNMSCIEPVSPIYDYLGRPVVEYRMATEPPCREIEEKRPTVVSRMSKAEVTVYRKGLPCEPPALPPCNAEKDKKKLLQALKASQRINPLNQPLLTIQSTLQQPKQLPCSDYESIGSYYYEKTNPCYEHTDGDELYSCVRKDIPHTNKKKSTISFEESNDSAYNSGSSSNYCGSVLSNSTKTSCGYNYIDPSEQSKKCDRNEYNYIDPNDSKHRNKNFNFNRNSSTDSKHCNKTFLTCDNSEYNYIDPSDRFNGSNLSERTNKNDESAFDNKDSLLKIIHDGGENASSSSMSDSNISNNSSEKDSNYSIACTSNSSASETTNMREIPKETRFDQNKHENYGGENLNDNDKSKNSNKSEICNFKNDSSCDLRESKKLENTNTSNYIESKTEKPNANNNESDNSNFDERNNSENIESVNTDYEKSISCNESSVCPEPPDMSELASPHPEQRMNKRQLPLLIIKPLPPKIEISPSNPDEELRVRL